MKRGQRKAVSPSGMTEQQTASSKPNRLSRSYRPSQQTQTPAQMDPPGSQQLEFKTPTRRSRSRSGVFRSSSPHNDSDFQQDIIWDATSPSPHRLGKRGRRQQARAVDISEIVDRIAPKHGRPEAAESALQQWIGDSATIPCTPEVRVSKAKKSPRSNGVNDLLKLAKQFDFMFHEEEEDEQRSELLSEDIPHPDAGPAAAAEEADLPMDDDLDFLFDGATQQVSGALSPAPSGANCSSLRSSSAADVKGTLANNGFEDDWEDDDLLSDALLLEMTENPHQPKFTSPKFCSTQKPPGCEEPTSRGHQSPAGIRLDSSPAFSAGRVHKQVLSGRAVGSEWTRPVTWDQQEPVGGSSSAESNQNFSPRSWRPGGDDPVWDDPADDQLLCELCEGLENQLQKERLASPQQRAALQPANRNPPLPTSLAQGCVSKVPAAVAGQTGLPSAPKRSSHHGQFTFKKPANPVTFKAGGAGSGLTFGGPSSAVSAAAPCSAAQIELKKQQALQRRRRRLELAQGLGPPT